jgi:hypothetical protein
MIAGWKKQFSQAQNISGSRGKMLPQDTFLESTLLQDFAVHQYCKKYDCAC